jgi:hypothetical protein
MTGPDYPVLALPGNEAYQLAHIATYIASAIARHRRAVGRSKDAFNARWAAARDIAGSREALARALGGKGQLPSSQLPQAIDSRAFEAARKLLSGGPRWAEVVSLAAAGERGWAVLGHVPGVGPVGARLADQGLAEAVRQHLLTQPAAELSAWAVTDRRSRIPPLPDQVDLRAFVKNLDPATNNARAVAAALRGVDEQVDSAIGRRFAGVDLDEPIVVRPPAQSATSRRSTPPDATQAARLADAAPSAWQMAALGGTSPPQPGTSGEPPRPVRQARPTGAALRAAQVKAGTRFTYRRAEGGQRAGQVPRSAVRAGTGDERQDHDRGGMRLQQSHARRHRTRWPLRVRPGHGNDRPRHPAGDHLLRCPPRPDEGIAGRQANQDINDAAGSAAEHCAVRCVQSGRYRRRAHSAGDTRDRRPARWPAQGSRC